MITNFLKSGFSSLESISLLSSAQNNSSKAHPQTSPPLDKVVEQTLAVLRAILTEQLGQQVDPASMRQLTESILKSRNMQTSLIQTKERYNDLVNKSTSLYQQARKISSCIGEFITSINMFLESDELLVPLSQIQRGISQLMPEKVEKQINYLVKIFANNFQEIIDKNVRLAERNMNQEIKLIKNLNKNLQTEIVSIKNNRNNDESKHLEQTMKITALNEKITKLINDKNDLQKELGLVNTQLREKMRLLSDQEAEIRKGKLRQNALQDKIQQLELKSIKAEKLFRESNNQSEALNIVIDKLKQRQEEIVEELELEFRKKEMQHESLRKKLFTQKANLEQKVELLTERNFSIQKELQNKNQENEKLIKQVQKYRESGFAEIELQPEPIKQESENQSQKPQKHEKIVQAEAKPKRTLRDLLSRISFLERQNKEVQGILQKERDLGVNRQVLKGLFLSYDDESKEWAVRRNIKYQIYTLLDLRDKIPKPEEPKSNKWFGIF